MNTPGPAQQGHRYRWRGVDVLALESGQDVRIAEIVPGQPWLGPRVAAYAFELEPLPMAYFHGQTPT